MAISEETNGNCIHFTSHHPHKFAGAFAAKDSKGQGLVEAPWQSTVAERRVVIHGNQNPVQDSYLCIMHDNSSLYIWHSYVGKYNINIHVLTLHWVCGHGETQIAR